MNLNLPLKRAKVYSSPAQRIRVMTEDWDLTQIETINWRVGWTYPPALPKWEEGCCSGYDKLLNEKTLG